MQASPRPPRFVGDSTQRRRRPAGEALLLLALAALLCTSCSRDIPNPFASFDTRCASLPPARYEVVEVPLEYKESDNLGIAELTAKSGSALARHRTHGLTTAAFGQQTQTDLRLIEQRASARACASPQVTVEVSMQPVVVYVASELASDRCQHDVTREHELRHVEVDREVLDQTARRLREEIGPAMAPVILKGPSGAAVAQQYEAALRDYLAGFMREQRLVLAQRQAAIDSVEEYARVASACRSG